MEEYFKAKTKFENIFENMILKAKTFENRFKNILKNLFKLKLQEPSYRAPP